MTAPATPAPAPAPTHTHPCARCGDPVALEVGLCERCNPLGLRDSASSQVHGTALLAVGLAIVGLALIGRLAISGIGPFPAEVAGVRSEGGLLTVTIRVTNEGTNAGTTTCRITDRELKGAGKPAFVLSPRIPPKATITFDHRLTGFGAVERPLDVACSAP
jgi:hypothetical protein